MFKHMDYCMVTVSDMQRSVEFYRDKLGLTLKFETPGWTEFQTGDTTLALHGGGKPGAQTRTEPMAGTCSIGFYVADIQQTYNDLQGRGVHFVMPPTLREQEGIHLSVLVDPDGLAISLAQQVQSPAHNHQQQHH